MRRAPDERVLVVPPHDPRIANMVDIANIDRLEITRFFEVY